MPSSCVILTMSVQLGIAPHSGHQKQAPGYSKQCHLFCVKSRSQSSHWVQPGQTCNRLPVKQRVEQNKLHNIVSEKAPVYLCTPSLSPINTTPGTVYLALQPQFSNHIRLNTQELNYVTGSL